jgi:hypothetical protein
MPTHKEGKLNITLVITQAVTAYNKQREWCVKRLLPFCYYYNYPTVVT